MSRADGRWALTPECFALAFGAPQCFADTNLGLTHLSTDDDLELYALDRLAGTAPVEEHLLGARSAGRCCVCGDRQPAAGL
jgi:hypothetical protein